MDTRVDKDFIEWLRGASEAAWREHVSRDHRSGGVVGLDWRPGTHWRGALTEAEIDAAAARFGLAYPPDYRLFLATLHTPDPPMAGTRYLGSQLTPLIERRFPDWTGPREPIDAALAWPLAGLLQSIEQDQSWHPAWGERPGTPDERESTVRELAAVGPQLVPVAGHHYLAGPADVEGSPVLSIFGSDVIVYASSLRMWLPTQLGIGSREADTDIAVSPIPFWQDVIDGLPWPGRRPTP